MIQLQVLNRILKDKDASLITVNGLDESYFSDYKKEFQFIKNHINQYSSVPDIETFLNTFPEFEVIDVNESNDYLITELNKEYQKVFIAENFNKIRSLLIADKLDDALLIYRESLDKMKSTVKLSTVDILQDTSRYDNYLDKLNDFDKYYIKTGFPELDKILGGWDRNEELVGVVARTNVGKTWFLLKMAASAVEQGLRVGFYSGEMSEQKIGYRFDTIVSHISNGALTHGNDIVQNDYKRYVDTLPNRFTGCLKILTPQMIKGFAGVNALRAFIESENLDILFVDQYSLLDDDRRGRSESEQLTNIVVDMKHLQVMKRIPIIVAAQQNRESTENGVGSEHVAGSDKISRFSTILLFIEKKDDLLKLHLGKSRDSINDVDINYNVDFNKGQFIYVPNEKDALKGQSDTEYEHRYDTENDEDVF